MANGIPPVLAIALNQFINWFEDNMGEETYLDEEGPKSYLDLPEFQNLLRAINKICGKEEA